MGIAFVGDGTRIAIDCDIGDVGPLADRSFVIAGDQGMMVIEPRLGQGLSAHSLTLVSSTGTSLKLEPGDLADVDADYQQMAEMIAWIRDESENCQDAHLSIRSHAIMMGDIRVRPDSHPRAYAAEDQGIAAVYNGRGRSSTG